MKAPVKPAAGEDSAGKKREEADRAWQEQVSARQAESALATAKARRIKIEQLARRDPAVRDLLEDRDALAALGKSYAAEKQQLENAAADLRAQLEALTAENATLKAEAAELRSRKK